MIIISNYGLWIYDIYRSLFFEILIHRSIILINQRKSILEGVTGVVGSLAKILSRNKNIWVRFPPQADLKTRRLKGLRLQQRDNFLKQLFLSRRKKQQMGRTGVNFFSRWLGKIFAPTLASSLFKFPHLGEFFKVTEFMTELILSVLGFLVDSPEGSLKPNFN